MSLWITWWNLVLSLRPAFGRYRTFLWFSSALAAFCVREDLRGVTSFVRALGLHQAFYDRLLDFFHSPAVDVTQLTALWTGLVLRVLKPFLLTVNGRIVLPCVWVGDSYYATAKIILPLLQGGNHLVTALKSNAVAYEPAPSPGKRKRGRPRCYGTKIRLKTLFEDASAFTEAPSPVYGEKGVALAYRSVDLLWRPVGCLVRFVAVIHPHRGCRVFLSTDLSLTPLEIIALYGVRFKIEVSFKQAVHTVGTYSYHFWMMPMTPISRRSGNQHLHCKSDRYREQVRRKIRAYHCHLQTGVIAQGLLQILSVLHPQLVWSYFGSWIRTIRPGIPPSEQIVSMALRHRLPEFLAGASNTSALAKFLSERLDLNRAEGMRLAA